MKAIEIAFVVYPVTDVARARRFYEGVLGLKETSFFGEGESQWIEYDIGPGTLAIGSAMEHWQPSSNGGTAALEVDDFDQAISELKAANVQIVMGPTETPVCNMAIILDPDGNALIVHKRKA